MQDDSVVDKISALQQFGEITKAVAELRAAAHAVLIESRKARYAIAQQNRQALKLHRAQIRKTAAGICQDARRSMATGAAAVQRIDASRAQGCEDQKWEFNPEGDAASPITKHDMIRVIEQHPEGVSLMEIGNELGADWRGLVNWSHRLVIDGKVEKFDELFYPARE